MLLISTRSNADIVFPLYCQVMLGTGNPVAEQVSVIFSSISVTVRLTESGPNTISGPTGGKFKCYGCDIIKTYILL